MPWNKFHGYNIGRFKFHGLNSIATISIILNFNGINSIVTISAIPTEFISANAGGMTDIVAQGFNPGKQKR